MAGPDTVRLIILSGEDDKSKAPEARGRPLGPDFWLIERKIAFMNLHVIGCSVFSLANPLLCFLVPEEAAIFTSLINVQMDEMCRIYPERLLAFGTLPLSGTVGEIRAQIRNLMKYGRMRDYGYFKPRSRT